MSHPSGNYFCTFCKTEHWDHSKVGKAHFKRYFYDPKVNPVQGNL